MGKNSLPLSEKAYCLDASILDFSIKNMLLRSSDGCLLFLMRVYRKNGVPKSVFLISNSKSGGNSRKLFMLPYKTLLRAHLSLKIGFLL